VPLLGCAFILSSDRRQFGVVKALFPLGHSVGGLAILSIAGSYGTASYIYWAMDKFNTTKESN
jgi:hypothetical protein